MDSACLLALVLVAAPGEDRPWRPAGEGPGTLRWYTREVPGSPVNELRAQGVLDAPAEEVYAVLADHEAYPRFMPHTQTARVLEQAGDLAVVYYRYTIPMIQARDTVVRVETTHLPDKGMWTISWEEAPAKYALAPVPPGTLRLQLNRGTWKVFSYQGKTFLTYHLHSVPGGNVPVFLVNQMNGSGVPGTFNAIKREVDARRRQRRAVDGPAPGASH